MGLEKGGYMGWRGKRMLVLLVIQSEGGVFVGDERGEGKDKSS